MKILYAVPGYKPAYKVGGPILSVSAVAENLTSRGHEVIVITSNSNVDEDLDVPCNQPVQVDGVTVWYFRREEPIKRFLSFVPYLSKSIGFFYCPQMAEKLDQLAPHVDIIHTHLPFVYPTIAAARAAKRYRKPLFYHQRGVFDPERLKFRSLKKRAYIQCIERPIMRQANTLIALTESEEQSFRALGVETLCRVIPNGIDVAKYPRTTHPTLESWGIPDDATVILFLGRLHPIKGAHTLLEGFLQVQSGLRNAYLVLAGPDEWGLELKYKATVSAAGMEKRVFFPGMVSGEFKLALLSRADLFCLPSVGEGFSMAVLEALASSTAVLLSPGCHFPEVERANAGRIVEPEASVIAKTLAMLLSDRNALRRMGRAGHDLVVQGYTWNSVVDRLVDAYEDGIRSQAAVTDEGIK